VSIAGLAGSVKARGPQLSLAVVRDLREARVPAGRLAVDHQRTTLGISTTTTSPTPILSEVLMPLSGRI
jgi:hypothetical protein